MAILAFETLPTQLCALGQDAETRRFGDLDEAVSATVRQVLETSFLWEAEQRVGAPFYGRTPGRRDQRNGYRFRSLVTRYGLLEKIAVPRLRGENFVPSLLTKHQRVLFDVEEIIAKCLLCGASRTEVSLMLAHQFGYPPAESLLARVERLLEAQAKLFKNRPLTKRYVYLFLDGLSVTLREGLRARKRTVLVAVGITEEGFKEVLGFERVARENANAWEGFLSRLVGRGLDRSSLELVISDEAGALVTAVPLVLGDVAHQLCWAHRMRNAYETVSKSDRKAVIADLRQVYRAAHSREAKRLFVAFGRRWRDRYPSLVCSIEQDLPSLLAFFSCFKEHRSYLRTSNAIERLFRDVRAKTISFAGFSDGKRCDRWLYGIFWQANHRWGTKPKLLFTHSY